LTVDVQSKQRPIKRDFGNCTSIARLTPMYILCMSRSSGRPQQSDDGDAFETSWSHAPGNVARQPTETSTSQSPWLGVYFRCSGQYVRVFRTPQAKHYQARCPKCAQTIRFEVDPVSGSNQRLFTVSC